MLNWIIRERLNLLKLMPTRGALVLVRWHLGTPATKVFKNARLLLEVKCREVRVLPRIGRSYAFT